MSQAICQLCNQPVPPNEAISYNGNHEDCALNREKLPPNQDAGVNRAQRVRKSRGGVDAEPSKS